MKDPYEVLGVPRGASPKEIREAYKALARKHHPDVNPGDPSAEERFKDIQAASEVLSDPKKRAAYDRFGDEAFNPGRAGAYSGGDFRIPTLEEILGPGALGDLLASLFDRNDHAPGRSARKRPGQVIRAECEISLEDACRGVEREVPVRRESACAKCGGTGRQGEAAAAPCRTCGGRGQVFAQHGQLRIHTTCATCAGSGLGGEPCRACAGRGSTIRDEKVRFRIPAGIEDGAVLRVPGRGSFGPASTGDLLVGVRITPHPLIERRGPDLYVPLPVTYSEAALGARIPVPTIEGPALVNIPAGTPSGRRLRLAGKGMPLGDSRRGDLFADIRIVPPPNPGPEARALLERLAEVSHYDPRA